MGLFNSNTHKFKLLSGVEAEVRELTGKHQRLLTQIKKGEKHSDRLNRMLADLLVRVGTVKTINAEFVEQMLSEDRRHALIVARQYTMDFEDTFSFTYKYEHDGESKEHEVDVNLQEDGTFPIKKMPVQYDEYAEIEREQKVTLPKSGIEVKFMLLDGKGERIGATTKKSERSSHTILRMRRPQYFKKKEGGTAGEGTWMQLPLDQVGLKDLAFLREQMKSAEGKIDTEIQFEHPLWESGELDSSERYVVTDVLNTINFFFPSGSI